MSYEEFTKKEEEYIKQFLCNNTRLYYHELLYKDYIGTIPYTLDFNYDWNCDIMPWASDKIRLYYRAGLLNERILGKKLDSREPPFLRGRIEEKNNERLEVVEHLNFSQVTDFKGEIVLEYDEVVLQGLKTFAILYHPYEYKNTSDYDNWRFSTPEIWDEFWFSEDNSILYWSETFVVGQSAVDLAQI